MDKKQKPPPDLNTVGGRLRFARKRMKPKVSQIDLGDSAGVEQSSVSDVETGKSRLPEADVLIKYCHRLGIRPEWLLWKNGPIDAAEKGMVFDVDYQPPALTIQQSETLRSEICDLVNALSSRVVQQLRSIITQLAQHDIDATERELAKFKTKLGLIPPAAVKAKKKRGE